MAVNKLDPKIIFASTAPAQDVPAVFPNKTNGWGESRKNGGRPTIKQMNALQQETDLKILWLNENAVTPYDATIDYPNSAVTIKDGTFKILDAGVWKDFISRDVVSKLKTIPTYYSAEEGVDTVTGVPNGAYYNVRSTEDDSFLVEYQNIGGVPTPSGKSYPSSSAKWDSSFVVDGDKTQQELNKNFKNRIVYFEDVVSDVTGTVDVTAEMQALLDSHDGDIYAKSDSVFKTSNTLFNRKHNRTVNFHNAKIVNKANSRYVIVTISPAFVGNSEAQLAVFSSQRHYGNEVRSSHIKNLRYEMSSKSTTGANLGVGIVYGYKCFASRLYPIMTNGNAFEIRNSLQCGIYDSELEGHRNYTCFIFMSKKCFVIRNKLKGGARGVSTKMNRDGDPNCDHVIAFNTFEDSTSVARSIVGGEWRETNLTDEIYVSGHEWVDGNLIYGNTFINHAQPQTIHAACFSRNWKIYNNTFDWNNIGGQVMTFGGEGNVVEGEDLGGGHEFYSNTIYDYDANNNTIIGFRLSGNVYENKFYNCKSTLWFRAELDVAGKPLKFAHFNDNEFLGENNAVYCNVAGSSGFVGSSDVLNLSFSGNSGKLTALTNGVQKSLTLFVSAASNLYLSDGDFEIVAGDGVENIFAALIQAGSIRKLSGRRVTLSAPNTVYALQILSGVTVECKHENNSYNLVGSSTLARAVVNNVELVDGFNSYNGSWNANIFNSYLKPVALTNIDRQWSVMPTAGSYKKGDFVRNNNPSIVTNSVIFGWLRITSGSTHVLNTDWVEIKQSIA